MAQITMSTPEQLTERERKPEGKRSGRQRSPERTRIIEAYKAAMREAQPGYGADVVLADDEDKRDVRNNLKVAAEELTKPLTFGPSRIGAASTSGLLPLRRKLRSQ